MTQRKPCVTALVRRRPPLMPFSVTAAAIATAALVALWGGQARAQEAAVTCAYTNAGVMLFAGDTVLNLPDAVQWTITPAGTQEVSVKTAINSVRLQGTVDDVKRAIQNCAFVELPFYQGD